MNIFIYFATIFWSLFPNLIHVFQGGENFINKVNETNLITNGDFSDETTGWYSNGGHISANNGLLSFITNGTTRVPTVRQTTELPIFTNNLYYITARVRTITLGIPFIELRAGTLISSITADSITNPNQNQWYILKNIIQLTQEGNFDIVIRTVFTNAQDSLDEELEFDDISAFNVSTMILKGVKNDLGIPFSDLTNEQIKTQLYIWITEYGDLTFNITKDNTYDKWFNTGFVEKTAERDFLDYLGYFVWLTTPPIILFITLDLIRRLL